VEPPSKPLILVVDDNEVIRSLVKTILASQGMEIDSASDGDEALAYLRRRRPDVLLLDVGMPRVDGLEVLRQVRADPALHDLRVVMLTAVANTARFEKVYSHRPDGYLEKPFHVSDLIGAVRQALNSPAAQASPE